MGTSPNPLGGAADTNIQIGVWQQFVKRYRNNRYLFVVEVFGATPDPWQERVLKKADEGVRRISIRSGHGVGKTVLLSWLAIHHLLCFHPQKTVVTAPSAPQLFDALVPEMKSWITKLPNALQVLIDVKAERLTLAADPDTSFTSFRTSRADTPEALQGVHAEHVLLLVDEAPGVPEIVFEAGSGSMSGHNALTVLTGNPSRRTGFFADTHMKLADFWYTEQVSGEDSPRVSRDYIEQVKRQHGEKSNAYRVRVLGEFPLAEDDVVIPFEYVESAMNRGIVVDQAWRVTWGLDVARFGGDLNALCKRKDRVVQTNVMTWGGMDLMQTTGLVMAEWNATPKTERPYAICVDANGMGAGVADRLRELNLPVRAINTAELASTKGKHKNLRAELWWTAREWLATLMNQLPKDDALLVDLIGPKYKFASNGTIQIESKEDTKSRGLKSPNCADAFVLTFAADASTMLFGRSPEGRVSIRRNLAGIV